VKTNGLKSASAEEQIITTWKAENSASNW